jgi:hypothetical protein
MTGQRDASGLENSVRQLRDPGIWRDETNEDGFGLLETSSNP